MLNKVMLIGRLGADPEVRKGGEVVSVRIATSENWTDRNSGEKQERTEWHSVVFFGKVAGIAEKYLRKGGLVYVEGKLATSEYVDRDGVKRWSTQVQVSAGGVMRMLGGRRDDEPRDEEPRSPSSGRTMHQEMDDEIPF